MKEKWRYIIRQLRFRQALRPAVILYMFRKETFEHESVAINKNLLLEGGRSNELAKVTDNNNGRNRNVREFSETKYHKVSVGETLTSIAKRRGTTVAQLCKLNHLTRDVKVRPGQILRYS